MTISANGIPFIKPIKVGQLVQLTASIVHASNLSMHIYVIVRATDPTHPAPKVTNRCFITFMAVDNHGRLMAVPAFIPEGETDLQLELVAMHEDFAKQLDCDFTSTLGWH